MRAAALVPVIFFCFAMTGPAWSFESDGFDTSGGKLQVTFIGHGTLMFNCAGKVIHVDPVADAADYSKLPKADLILITHEHYDHFDPKAIEQLRTPQTAVVIPPVLAEKLKGATVMKNGDSKTISGLPIEAVPAYNVVHMHSPGIPYHPKGVGNGYVITFGDKRVYVAGDTENIPSMADLKDICIAFLPMNLPYTMTPEMAADAAKKIKPKILYPYHFGETDTSRLVSLLKGSGIDVRIRKLK